MLLTKWISRALILNWKALPLVLLALCWLFFTGFRQILKTKHQRILREFLFGLFCCGLGVAFLCFGTYGLVDPANGLARHGATLVRADELLRFEWMGYASLCTAVAAGFLLELSQQFFKKKGS